jgi:hypothetical protein
MPGREAGHRKASLLPGFDATLEMRGVVAELLQGEVADLVPATVTRIGDPSLVSHSYGVTTVLTAGTGPVLRTSHTLRSGRRRDDGQCR